MFSLLFLFAKRKLEGMKRPYKHFDIPKQHLSDIGHYVPPKARTALESERRHGRLPGTLLAESELRGLYIARHVIAKVKTPEEIKFAVHTLAPAGLNSTWYRIARASNRMRKVGRLPFLATGDDEELRPSSKDVHEQTKDVFAQAIGVGHGLVRAMEAKHRDIPMHPVALGNVIGQASLTLASVEVADDVRVLRPFETQEVVREQAIGMLGLARTMGSELGTHPSLAQLADPDSDFSVYLRRTAPDAVYEALDEAARMYAMPC